MQRHVVTLTEGPIQPPYNSTLFDIPLLNNLFVSCLNLFISLIELKNIH